MVRTAAVASVTTTENHEEMVQFSHMLKVPKFQASLGTEITILFYAFCKDNFLTFLCNSNELFSLQNLLIIRVLMEAKKRFFYCL